MRRLWSTSLVALLLGAVVAVGLASLRDTEHPSGWDGYYYLVQMQALRTTGEMHSPESSLVWPLLMLARAVSGDDVTSWRICAVLFKTLFVLSVFTLTLSMLRTNRSGGDPAAIHTALLAGALSAASPSLGYFFTQFPKNLLGFSLFLLFAASLIGIHRAPEAGERRPTGSRMLPHLAGALLLFLAAFFTHRFSAVLSLGFLLLYLAPSVRRLPRSLLLILPAGVIAVLALSHLLPLTVSYRDMERVTGDLSWSPIFVPVSFLGAFGSGRLTTVWIGEIVLAGILPILTGILLPFRRFPGSSQPDRGFAVMTLVALTGLLPFLRFSLTGLSYRLFFGTLLLLPLLCVPWIHAGVLRVIPDGKASRAAGRKAVPAAVFLALIATSLHTGRSYSRELHDPPYPFYDELAADAMDALSGSDCELIVAHAALAELITYRYGVDALPWAPEDSFPRERVWRITAGILRDEVSLYLGPATSDSFFIPLGRDYALMREDHWEEFLLEITDEPVMLEAVEGDWRNPLVRRPAYLRRRV